MKNEYSFCCVCMWVGKYIYILLYNIQGTQKLDGGSECLEIS